MQAQLAAASCRYIRGYELILGRYRRDFVIARLFQPLIQTMMGMLLLGHHDWLSGGFDKRRRDPSRR
jgi:hypothetical protein